MAAPSITAQAITLIKKHESFRPTPYKCPTGHLTIGYGHVIKPGEHFDSITMAQADKLLASDLEEAGRAVTSVIKKPLNNDQYSALCSWFFNLGNKKSTRESTLVQVINAGTLHLAAGEFGRWIYGTVKDKTVPLPGLITRRADEALLFISALR